MLRLERHALGPRVYLLGRRIHEFALGFAILGVLMAGGIVDVWDLTRRVEFVSAFGSWLVIKDWRDLIPSKRNTAAWSFLPHREPRDKR
jgi:hypothetical protein